jgi:hypothetical protein
MRAQPDASVDLWAAAAPASAKDRVGTASWTGFGGRVEDDPDLMAVASTLDTDRASTDFGSSDAAATLPPFTPPLFPDIKDGLTGGGDSDTVMAYARWLSEQKQQASSQRLLSQQNEDLCESIEHHASELTDFKRHSTRVVRQLQSQVSELRSKLTEALSQLQQQGRQVEEHEQRTTLSISELSDAMERSVVEYREGREATVEQLNLLQENMSGWHSKLSISIDTVEGLKQLVASGEEKVSLKACEVDKTIGMFHSWVTSVREELQECREDWSRGNDVLGQAIQTVSHTHLTCRST